ncbi:hypothetical protein PC111_g18225 [Phytophthora cactorum]|nr:hypothetical protein PC111_g18225 [Phytophthora cactorum]
MSVLQYDSDSDNKISSREEDHDDGEEFGDRILFEIQFDPARGQESTCSVVDGEETFRTRQGLDLSVVDQKVVVGEDAAAMFAIKSGL